ncbi:MAG: hypothetical protein LBP85_00750, partial [Prevotellaceae bacterium]|nr:hypothetical protein [Prevotellaceae bacterium]
MKKVSIFIIVIMFLFQSLSYSQIHTADTDMRNLQNHGFSFKSLVIPATLISYGIATRIFQPLQQMDHNIANETAKHYKYHTQADNYLQYIPHTAVFGLNFIGIKSKHNLRDRTFIVAASSIITALIVQTSKRT